MVAILYGHLLRRILRHKVRRIMRRFLTRRFRWPINRTRHRPAEMLIGRLEIMFHRHFGRVAYPLANGMHGKLLRQFRLAGASQLQETTGQYERHRLRDALFWTRELRISFPTSSHLPISGEAPQ